MTAGEIGARPASGSDRTDAIERELTALAAQLDRVKLEERRLYAARLVAWQEARRVGLSWRAIAAASGGMDHAQIAKTVNGLTKEAHDGPLHH